MTAIGGKRPLAVDEICATPVSDAIDPAMRRPEFATVDIGSGFALAPPKALTYWESLHVRHPPNSGRSLLSLLASGSRRPLRPRPPGNRRRWLKRVRNGPCLGGSDERRAVFPLRPNVPGG